MHYENFVYTSISTVVINAVIDRAVAFVILNPVLLLDTFNLFYCAMLQLKQAITQ